MKKFLLFSLINLCFANACYANNATAVFDATAKLNNSCTFSSSNLNFGTLMGPLSAQGTTGQMTLLCSKGADYKIDIAYGGIYGQGKPGDGSYWEYTGNNNSTYYYKRTGYNPATNKFVQLETRALTGAGYGYMSSAAASALGCTIAADRCNMGTTAYDYGVMKGVSMGDSVGYSIYVPGDNSKVWNSGKNSYSSTGTGEQESISFQAKIVPQVSKSYPAADTYMDTITATLSY